MPNATPTLIKCLERVHRRTGHQPHECFRSFVRMSACALATGRREEEYLAEAKRWKPEDLADFSQALAAMVDQMELGEPFADFLGPIHMEWGGDWGKKAGGEFYTPFHIAEFMAEVQFDSGILTDDRPITVQEPACGSGVMVLAFAKVMQSKGVSPRRMRAVMYDVSPLAIDMAFIQTTLWGIPALVKHGNALSGEVWNAWPNFFWSIPPQWLDLPADEPVEVSTQESAVPAPEPIQIVLDKRGQFSMDFTEAA